MPVFVSDGCHVCRALEPAMRSLASDPLVAVESFDEVADAPVWEQLGVARAVKPGDADAFRLCGHILTTGSCPHPTGTPRIDGSGYPIRATTEPRSTTSAGPSTGRRPPHPHPRRLILGPRNRRAGSRRRRVWRPRVVVAPRDRR